ncbi:hypothetical protein B0H11DRAFT_1925696 [Mycena galericulata]|nr:hypothetical protein B0H11DRAFT_1925696 [Mycena galericulata]
MTAKARADKQLLQDMSNSGQACWWDTTTLAASIDPNGFPRAFLFGYVLSELRDVQEIGPQRSRLKLGPPIYEGRSAETIWMSKTFKRQLQEIKYVEAVNAGHEPKSLPHLDGEDLILPVAMTETMEDSYAGCTVIIDLKLWPIGLRSAKIWRTNLDAKMLAQLEKINDGGKATQKFLARFSDSRLFRIALHSKEHWKAVIRSLKSPVDNINRDESPHINIGNGTDLIPVVDFSCTDTGSDEHVGWNDLPAEMHLEILRNSDLRSLTTMASGCEALHNESNRIIEAHISHCFEAWDLDWMSLRFMMAQTGSVISGLWAHNLIFPNRAIKWEGKDSLEIFVRGPAERGVLQYFLVATKWRERADGSTSHIHKWVEDAVTLEHPDGDLVNRYIALHICRDPPELSLYHQPLTGMFVTMSGNGIRVPYADLTFGDMALINHEFVEASPPDKMDDLHLLFERATNAGVEIIWFHSTSGGTCTGDLTCPAVVRTSLDKQTFSVVFRTRRWGSDQHSRQPRSAVVWSLGGKGCGKDVPLGDFFVQSFDVHWASPVLDEDYAIAVASVLDG